MRPKTEEEKSNERIREALEPLKKIMSEERRGFVFAPMAQDYDTIPTTIYLAGKNPGEITKEMILDFYTTLTALVESFRLDTPENLQKDNTTTFIATMQTIIERCFPEIELEEKK